MTKVRRLRQMEHVMHREKKRKSNRFLTEKLE
jgi:hypothetical protein